MIHGRIPPFSISNIGFNPLSPEADFGVSYVHSCIKLAILIKTSTNKPSLKSWLLNLLPNQASLAAQEWFGKRFKNH